LAICYNLFMHNWNLAAGDPLTLTLAADARLVTTNYADDQIWELSLGGGEPAALALQTTYGLRAHWLRLFPRFVRGETARTDPASFHTSPHILSFYPNTLTLSFAPFDGLEVLAEYRVSESNLVTGRLRITNNSILPQNFRLEWVSLLNPIDRQGGMVAVQTGPTSILEGETSYLNLAVFMTGGAQPSTGPYPALALDLELYPGNARQFTWAASAARTRETALEAARTATARPWEAEQTRVEMLNLSQAVHIQTGNPDWDAAFALTQKEAGELLFYNPPALPYPSFVLSRRPDHGFSLRGDGSDQIHLWSGQTALDSYYLSSLFLPGAPEIPAGLLRNFLSVQDENGVIDWKPGLGGQRVRRLAQPLLATLAVRCAPYMKQPDWYNEVFSGLLRFFDTWFGPQYDKDGDGFPEWEQPQQTGIEDSPIFDRWSPNAQGIHVERLECPGLAAMLLQECQSLIEIARALIDAEKADAAYARLSGNIAPAASGAIEALARLAEREENLRAELDRSWDSKKKIYAYRDYQTHLSLHGELLHEFLGTGRITSRKRFSQPRRLIIHLLAKEERSYPVVITITGFAAEGELVETLGPRSFSWHGVQGRATTLNTFLALKRIEIQGMGEEDKIRVSTADLTQEDCSLFLPLWAGAPDAEKGQQLVEDTLLPRYMRPFGIPLCPPDSVPQATLPGLHTSLSSALLPWNHLIGEGLLRYGYRAQAAELVTHLMNAVVPSLKSHQAFRQYYDSETGLAAGERGHLHGLAPIGLFLKTLGLQHLTPNEILLDGFNPFPWVVNVQYRKVRITFLPDRTEIAFARDQNVTIDQPGPHRINLS
jgi:hypothetical protein